MVVEIWNRDNPPLQAGHWDYGNDRAGSGTKGVSNPYCVSLWSTIRQGLPAFLKSIQFEVGVGNRIKFWHHVWCEGCTLQKAFPKLYSISCNKGSSIEDVMHFPNQRLHWDLHFSRDAQDWELEHFYTFLDLINSMLLNNEGQDKLSRQGSLGGHQSIDLWKDVPHCVLWCIWLEWNSRWFEGKERSISDFKSLLFHTLLEWRSSFNLFPCSNFLEMLDHCNLGVWCTVIHVHTQCNWIFH